MGLNSLIAPYPHGYVAPKPTPIQNLQNVKNIIFGAKDATNAKATKIDGNMISAFFRPKPSETMPEIKPPTK